MTIRTRMDIGLLLGLVLGVFITIGHGVFADKNEKSVLPLDDLRTFTDIFARIKNDYVVETEDKELLENAIRGMLTGLDPHSSYLNEEEFRELQIGTTGEFGGLGIEVGMEDGFVKVISPIDDTPAQRAGIESGDLIIRLDEQPVKGMSLNDAVKIMRGKIGTDITLTIVREGTDKPLKITIKRDVIRVKSVKNRSLEPGFGYLRITNFQSKTTRNLIDAVENMKKENNGELKGMVLDLRNNPGGVLTGAVGVSDAFLEEGLIVYTEGRVDDSVLRYSATGGDILNGAPLVILINGGSASASEIVAGALQDHRRAVVMGTKSFGKGSVQTILPLNEKSALKLTTARYFTPSGNSIQAEGITPDIVLENLKVSEGEKSDLIPLKEADLARHLLNGKTEENTEENTEGNSDEDKKENTDNSSNDDSADEEKEKSLASEDYQLNEALNLLKGIYILNHKG